MEVSSTAGGIVGETFACLIAEHFKQQKYSDRFFYELGNQAHSFSAGKALFSYFVNVKPSLKKIMSVFRPTCANQESQ